MTKLSVFGGVLKKKSGVLIGCIGSHVFVWTLIALTPILRVLPVKFWSFFAWLITPVVWKALKRRRKQTILNLQTILGLDLAQACDMGKRSFHSNLLVLFESIALTRLLDEKDVKVEVSISPEARKVIEGLKSGEIKMALALSGHSGVWEFVGAHLARSVQPASTVVASKLPRNPVLAKFLRDVRSRHGLTLIDKNKFSRHIIKQQQQDSSFLNIFLCDQHFNRAGAVKVPFLGKPACTVGLPATIINKYGVPTLIGHCIRKHTGHYLIEIECLKTDDLDEYSSADAVVEITNRLNNTLSGYISQAPEQWTWGHRRWRDCCNS